jgi:hypothetical protein
VLRHEDIRGMKLWLHLFLASRLDGGELSVVRCFVPKETRRAFTGLEFERPQRSPGCPSCRLGNLLPALSQIKWDLNVNYDFEALAVLGCYATNVGSLVNVYQHSQRNKPQERRSHLHHGGGLNIEMIMSATAGLYFRCWN